MLESAELLARQRTAMRPDRYVLQAADVVRVKDPAQIRRRVRLVTSATAS